MRGAAIANTRHSLRHPQGAHSVLQCCLGLRCPNPCSYCFNQNATGDITNVTDCANNLQQMWALERDNQAAIGGGSFMTEFGAVGPNPSSAEALGVWADLADSALESWTYWSYKGFDDITTQASGGGAQ